MRDVQFTQLFLIWLASLPRRNMSLADQVLAVQNFKNAAHFDLRTVHIVMPEFREKPVKNALEAALYTMEMIRAFYRPLLPELPDWAEPVLRFENEKLKNPEKRYAAVVRDRFSGTFLEKGMAYAVQETLKH